MWCGTTVLETAAGDRARPAGRRRRYRPVRRARRDSEHAAAVGAAGRPDDGADRAAARRRTRRQAVPDPQHRRSPVRPWLSARTGRCPRVRRWTASRSRCPGRPPTASPRADGRPHEILPIERALSAYTAGVAYQAFAEDGWGRLDSRRERRSALAGPRPKDHCGAGASGARHSSHVSARQAGLLGHGLEERTICPLRQRIRPSRRHLRRRGKAISSGSWARRPLCSSGWCTWCRSRCSPPTAS